MITIVIAEAALETVPPELLSHPSVKKLAERKGKLPEETLLDISYHYAAMKDLRDWDRRGRPDITYITLLNLLERPLNKEGLLKVYVHTIGNFVIDISPEINLPKNYSRFLGLVEQLFQTGNVPPRGKPLMILKKGRLEDVVKNVGHTKVVFLTEKGKAAKSSYFRGLVDGGGSPMFVIGGFQRGEFSRDNLSLADDKVSVYSKPLDAWIVASMVAHEVERALKIIQ